MLARKISAIAVSLVFALGAGAEADFDAVLEEHLTEEAKAKMADGEIVLVRDATDASDGARRGGGLSMALIAAPCGEVWDYLLDYEAYPEYMPRVRETTSYGEDGDEIRLAFTLRVTLRTIRYNIIQQRDRENFELSWHIDPDRESDIRATDGIWRLLPHGEDACIAAYTLEVDTGMAVPRFIENFLLNRDLPGIVKALKKRVESGGEFTQ